MKSEARMIKIEDIVVKNRKRPLKDIEALKTSIKDIGLLNPITVYRNSFLVAGYHRLEACKALGWTEIPAITIENDNLKAEQAQIDENIIRNKLTALEMAEQLKRRKEIYELRWPETTKDNIMAANRKQNYRSELSSLRRTSFVEDTALNINKSKRSIQVYIQIATGLSQEIRDLIRGTVLEDRYKDLLTLSRIEYTERQRELVEKIINGEGKTIAGILRKEKQSAASTLPDLTKPTVPTRLFKRIYRELMDLQISYGELEVAYNKLKGQGA